MSWNQLPQHHRDQLAKQLTPRQLDVYRLRLAGLSWETISDALNISIRTARTHHRRAHQIHRHITTQQEAA